MEAALVKNGDGGKVFTLEAQLPVGVILYYGDAITIGECHKASSARKGEGCASGVLEVGEDIHELGAGAQGSLQLVGDHAMGVCAHGDVLGTVGVPGLQSAQVGRRFGEDAVAGIYEDFAQKVEGL